MFDKEKVMGVKEVKCYLLIAYVVLSFVFICITLYTNVKVQYGSYMYNNGVQAGVSQGSELGYRQAVSEVLEESKVCEPFSLFAGEENTSLINIECLQSSEPQQQASGTGEIQQPQTQPIQ